MAVTIRKSATHDSDDPRSVDRGTARGSSLDLARVQQATLQPLQLQRLHDNCVSGMETRLLAHERRRFVHLAKP